MLTAAAFAAVELNNTMRYVGETQVGRAVLDVSRPLGDLLEKATAEQHTTIAAVW